MIDLHHVSRWYGQVIGVNDVTCNIQPGVTALLGQNGAGKSTLLRLIVGQIRPTTGEVHVFGNNPFGNPDVYKRLGFCPEIDNFPDSLTGFEFVYRMARLSHYSRVESIRRSHEAIALVGMSESASRKLNGYSKGMKQRIKLAQAVVHDPDILLLDEPLNGLDPVGRRQFMDVLDQLSKQGKAIIVSSHVLFEVEQMTRSILMMHRGRLLASGDLSTIRQLIDKHPHRIVIHTSDPRKLASELMAESPILSAKISTIGQSVEVETRNPDEFYSNLGEISLNSNLDILGLESPGNNLEAVFQYLVER